ncbi:MAG TPA: polymer-forming cytoskeletal protein [Stellaceae bacterium]|nr:polymer-forming cytoskeletal protein [Stellaceae bacterium]
MADGADDLGIPMKPARPPAQGATLTPVGRPPAVPPRTAPELPRAVESAPPRPADPPPRRIGDTVSAPAPVIQRRSDSEDRKLIVGREISLSGQITSCDKLVVEGSVEADVTNCRDVDIAESGLFKGSATIESGEIRGRFEGNLICRKRLLIKSTGRVAGTIRYGQIEIECGGQISGDIQAQPGAEGEIIDGPGARIAG